MSHVSFIEANELRQTSLRIIVFSTTKQNKTSRHHVLHQIVLIIVESAIRVSLELSPPD